MQASREPGYDIGIDRQQYNKAVSKKNLSTNAAVAEYLDVPEPTLSRLLAGKAEPSAKTIDRMLTGLELSYHQLFIRKERQHS